MGALRATVSMRGREIDILFSHIEFSRKTDNKGRPVTSVIGGRLTFSIEVTKDTEILESMVNSQFKPVSGKITLYRTDVVFYKEVFNVDKKRPLFTTITLSADSLIVGNAFLTNSW